MKIRFPAGVKTTGKVIVTISLLALLCRRLDLKNVAETLLKADSALLVISFVVLCLRNVICALRWQLLLKARSYAVPLSVLTRYYFIGIFFNFFLPTAVGGDLARGYYLFSRGVSKTVTFSSMIVERVLGVLSLVGISLIALPASADLFRGTPVSAVVITAAGLFTGLFFCFFTGEPKRSFEKSFLKCCSEGWSRA